MRLFLLVSIALILLAACGQEGSRTSGTASPNQGVMVNLRGRVVAVQSQAHRLLIANPLATRDNRPVQVRDPQSVLVTPRTGFQLGGPVTARDVQDGDTIDGIVELRPDGTVVGVDFLINPTRIGGDITAVEGDAFRISPRAPADFRPICADNVCKIRSLSTTQVVGDCDSKLGPEEIKVGRGADVTGERGHDGVIFASKVIVYEGNAPLGAPHPFTLHHCPTATPAS